MPIISSTTKSTSTLDLSIQITRLLAIILTDSVRVRSEKFKDCKPSMAETLFFNALRAAIDEEMARDSAVYVMGEDVGHYGGSYKVTKDLHKKYGDMRVLDTPIAENSFVGMAIGSAMTDCARLLKG